MFKKILIAFFVWKICIYLFALFAFFVIPQGSSLFSPHQRFRIHFPYLVWVWGNFDGQHYMEIAERGYQTFEQAFFPLLPILISLLFRLLRIPYIIGGQVVSNLALVLSLIVLLRLLEVEKIKISKALFILTIVSFPTSFFYQSIYNDSLFLLLASLTIYFARKSNWILASLFGSAATLARLNGLALIIFILAEYVSTKYKNSILTWNQKNIFKEAIKKLSIKEIAKSKIGAVLLIPISFVGYLIYVQQRFGNWHLLFSSLSIWKQDKLTFPLQVFFRYGKILILHDRFTVTYWVAVIELLFVLFYMFLLIWAYKKIRLSYWIFFMVSFIIPTLTGSFAGMPRYGLHLYPLYLSLSLFLAGKTILLRIFYFSIAIILFFITLALFTRGYFVA